LLSRFLVSMPIAWLAVVVIFVGYGYSEESAQAAQLSVQERYSSSHNSLRSESTTPPVGLAPQQHPTVVRQVSSSQPAASELPPVRQANGTALAQGSSTELASPEVPASKTDVATKGEIENRLAEIEANKELPELTKARLLKKYKAAQDWLRTAAEASSKATAYEAEVLRVPQILAEAKAKLAEPVKDATVAVPLDASLAQIEQLVTEAQSQFKQVQESLAKREESLQKRTERKAELVKLAEETKQRLEESHKQQNSPSVPEEEAFLSDARRAELDSRVLALGSQLALYKAEISRYDARAEVAPLMRDIAKRDKVFSEAIVAAWQKIVTDHRKRESELQAAEALRQVRDAHPALKSLAERNAVLAEQRKVLAASIANVTLQAKSVARSIEKLKQQFQKAEHRVRRAGHSATVGLMLRRQQEDLPSLRECSQRISEIQTQMPEANLALIELEEEREDLGDVEANFPELLSQLVQGAAGGNAVNLEPTVRKLLETKSELLASLTADYETYLDDLSELEVSNRQLTSQVQEASSYIREHVLWIRSADMLWTDDLKNAAQGAAAIAVPEQWIKMANQCGLDLVAHRGAALSVCLIVIVLSMFHSRLKARMDSVCSSKSGGASLKFRPTIQAIMLAAIIATEWPLVLAFLGWRMSSDNVLHGLMGAFGVSLLYAAALLWVSSFVKLVVRAEGLAETHFGWTRANAKLFRKQLKWLTVLGMPIAILTVCMQHFQEGQWSESIGRISFVLGMLLLAKFMHSIFSTKENILREAITQDSGRWFARLRAISHAAGVGIPLLLAVLAIAGYYYSAQQVALRWQAMLGVALVLLFTYSVAARWCLVKRRNLAMAQARERQQQAAANATTNLEAGADVTTIKIEDQQPDLSAIHEQLRYLLRHAVTAAMVVCSWFIWADVLPALKVFDHVVLWETMAEVTEIHEAVDGRLERTTSEVPVATTLRHAFFACLLVVATFVIGRNLPALLEVTVLQTLPFDKGGRHAISVLLRYAVVLTGVFLACQTLSFTWSSVQWLAAGMTVGLGFGLQEIFANFVSGLILLFERPIRVGDVITLGDVTGTVSGMRIRATTITNFDRKELIVPNKDLITGRLLNWTLSDTTNRIVITVGVAYKSDPSVARELLLDVVKQHPNVLEEPGPNVTFEEFADSALNLVIRAYIASMNIRLTTISELHLSIHAALREAGIEIAFPQRDINVRGLEQAVQPLAIQNQQKVA
jgi:potassium efflux system protein